MDVVVSIINIISLASIYTAGLITIFKRNSKSSLYFSFFTFALGTWLLLQYITQVLDNQNYTLWLLRISFVFSNIFAILFVIFMQYFVDGRLSINQRKIDKTIILFTTVLSLIDLTPLSLVSAHADLSGITTELGSFYNIKILYIVFCLLYGVVLLIIKTIKTDKKNRRQQYILLGALSQALFFSVILTTLFTSSKVFQLELPVTLLIMIVMIDFAIIKHRLFDVRAAVARSVAYLFTLLIVALIYVAPTLILASYILHAKLQPAIVIYLALISLVVVFLFQPLRGFINKISNTVFYRDYYDIQTVLDKLSGLLVGSIEVDKIINESSNILKDAIKPNFINFIILTEQNKLSKYTKLIKVLSNNKTNMLITEELDLDKKSLLDDLNEQDVAVTIRLRTPKEDLGYIICGYKKSGTIYSDKDKQLLSIAADEIAISLQNALRFEEIQRFNLTLQEKVDEATLKLRRANDKLRALDETKDDFISMASHQLRTPLTSVKGYLSMVLDGDVGNITKAQKEMLNQAFFSSQRMVYIIADLLNVSRLKTGKFIIERNPINLANVIKQELSQVEEIAASKNLRVIYEKPTDFPVLLLDETKTRQAIMNFVDNAIYYTPTGGEIKIRLINNPQTIELRVEDSGIGVPKTEQHHLFTKFYRAGNARKARPDGTGLGLFMAKKVVLAEGGSIIFDSQEGKGSTFGFIFSKAKIIPTGKEPLVESSETKELAEV
jgi:signal transduction histidine kinase